MNKKLGLAVAGALVAFSSAANAGITIPAGDWTVDIGGNVNAFATNTTSTATGNSVGSAAANGIGTGLLPAAFGIGAKTRQNDLDIAFQFSFFTGTSQGAGTTNLGAGDNSLNIRQAFLTFGDASWGTIKAGRDLGLYGSEVILSDMTLLGVGPLVGKVGGNATYGHIGSGYQYADWMGQIAYATPSFNGFQATVAVTEPYAPLTAGSTNNQLGFQGKATYDFAANDVTGKVWVGGIYQDRNGASAFETKAWEIGAKAGYAGAELVGYYYAGDALSSTSSAVAAVANGGLAIAAAGAVVNGTSSGGFVQATYKIPTIGTKVGVSWGTSLAKDANQNSELENSAWTVGAYHPLTKSLNLVAEYSRSEAETSGYAPVAGKVTGNTTSLGAILFF